MRASISIDAITNRALIASASASTSALPRTPSPSATVSLSSVSADQIEAHSSISNKHLQQLLKGCNQQQPDNIDASRLGMRVDDVIKRLMKNSDIVDENFPLETHQQGLDVGSGVA
mmetsp:Transcript_18135/g.30445  ORF Transcript_18135/g.30445 Transcript_18135/m.30445 type:complete len:116 (-) Transcript_18135:827-1174(-)